MYTKEKLQLIDRLRKEFVGRVREVVQDEPGIVGSIAVSVTFYEVEKASPLWKAAKQLGWKYKKSGGTAWINSESNEGDTTLFL